MSLKGEKSNIDDARIESDVDVIYFGGEEDLPPPPQLTEAEEKRLWRKIDRKLMPILTVLYLLSFIDRGNIGNARLQGLEKGLHLTGNQFNIALTIYFIPYAVCECVSNLFFKKFRPSRWLPGITSVWGIIMILMGIVKNYDQLVATRAMLGMVEAGLFPGAAYYLSIWYPRYHFQYRIAIFFGAASIAGAFSGLLAYGIGFMDGIRGLAGWSWLFIIEGLLTIVVSFVAFFVMVDYPATAKFLTPEERAFVIWKKKYDNSSVGEEEHFEWRHFWAVLKDWQVYIHSLIGMCAAGPLYGIAFFLPTIIHTFGYSAAVSQLLSVPPYVCATITLGVFSHFSDKLRLRSPFLFAGLLMLAIGFSINIADVSHGAKYLGTFFCVTGAFVIVPGMVAWLGNNLAGQYKRGIGMAFQLGFSNFSGAMACNFYRTQDSPRFILGHGLELMFAGLGLIAVSVALFSYLRINRKRDEAERIALESGQPKKTARELRMLGDRAPDFRYTL